MQKEWEKSEVRVSIGLLREERFTQTSGRGKINFKRRVLRAPYPSCGASREEEKRKRRMVVGPEPRGEPGMGGCWSHLKKRDSLLGT